MHGSECGSNDRGLLHKRKSEDMKNACQQNIGITDAQMGQRRKNKGVYSDDLWRRKMSCQCGHAFAKTKWHTKTDFITYTYKCYDQTRTGTIAARLKNGLSIENVCRSPLVQDWKMYTMA